MQFNEAKKILTQNKQDLVRLGVRNLALFGSDARNENRRDSDIDILIEFDSKVGIFVFVDLKIFLEDILKCDVDLVTKNALHPALKEKILHEAKYVF